MNMNHIVDNYYTKFEKLGIFSHKPTKVELSELDKHTNIKQCDFFVNEEIYLIDLYTKHRHINNIVLMLVLAIVYFTNFLPIAIIILFNIFYLIKTSRMIKSHKSVRGIMDGLKSYFIAEISK